MSSSPNVFTDRPVGLVLLRTALPIVLLTTVSGMLTVVDAILLGVFVGQDALAAVTLVFPASMALVAIGTMVSSGMASQLARALGAGRQESARSTFAGAHGLALLMSGAAIVLYYAIGQRVISASVADSTLARMAQAFLAISVATSPVMMLLNVHSDALRVEGKVGMMALIGLGVTLGNIALNAVLVVVFQLGVAGSAAGTALAQFLALVAVIAVRTRDRRLLPFPLPGPHLGREWVPILALGAPRSLGFLGIGLGSFVTLAAVALYAPADQPVIVAAYGVVTRVMTFAYLPLLGLSLALQAVAGNNAGAGLLDRSRRALRLSLVAAAVYCGLIALVLWLGRDWLGGLFVGAAAVDREVSRILPYYAALYVSMGPVMMLASYAQCLGEVRRAAVLSLARTYLFAIPLTLALPLVLGSSGIWAAVPAADLLMIAITAAILWPRRLTV